MKPDELAKIAEAFTEWAYDHDDLLFFWAMWAVAFGTIAGVSIPGGEWGSLWWIELGSILPIFLYALNGSVAWLRSGNDRKQAKLNAAREKQKALEAEVL